MAEETMIIFKNAKYSKADLMKMDQEVLRALLHERAHHMIEVPIYPLVLSEKGRKIENFGNQPQLVFDVWCERGFPQDEPDILWVKRYLALAAKIRSGEEVRLEEPIHPAFSPQEMAVLKKLFYERRSYRHWIKKEVPDAMIEQILEAGRAAPNGCNLNLVRFIVIKDPEEAKMVWSDIPTENAVLIVLCFDERSRQVVGQHLSVPQNAGYDAAAAADHMLLMAHALGLGGIWLTCTKESAQKFKEQYGLPEYIQVALHIAVGWPAIGMIKSDRMPLKEMIIKRKK